MKYLFKGLRWFLLTIVYGIIQIVLILWHLNFEHCENYLIFINRTIEMLEADNSDDGWGY